MTEHIVDRIVRLLRDAVPVHGGRLRWKGRETLREVHITVRLKHLMRCVRLCMYALRVVMFGALLVDIAVIYGRCKLITGGAVGLVTKIRQLWRDAFR